MKAIIYRRVSDEKQVEKYSLPAQLKLCRDLCLRNGWEIAGELVDEGYSGALFEERPAFSNLLKIAEQKEVDVIVVTDLDRLARPDNLVDLGKLQRVLIENNIKLATISGRVSDLSNSSDWFFSSLESLMAGWERKKIKERVKRGVKEKKLQGYFWGTLQPSGYVREKGNILIPNPSRIEKSGKGGRKYTILSASEVKEIFDLFLKGESILSIAKKLNTSESTTRGIINRAMFYAGYILDMKDEKKVLGKGLHQPLITESQAKTALNLKSKIKKIHEDNRAKFPSHGIIKCALCGTSINLRTAIKPKVRYYYYICGKRKYALNRKNTPCTLPAFRVSEVEKKIWNTVEKIVTSPESIFNMLSSSNVFLQNCYERLSNIESELSALNQRKKRVMELYEFINSPQELKEHKQKIEKLNAQIQAKQKEIEEIYNDIKIQESIPKKHKEIAEILEMFQEVITEAEPSEKRNIIMSIFDEILLHPKGDISYKVKIPAISIKKPQAEKESKWAVCQTHTTVFCLEKVKKLEYRTVRATRLP